MTTPLSSNPTASSALPVGTRLAEFDITGVIGEGGFGIVYSAHDSSLDRIVAVKEYLPSAFALRAPDGTVKVKFDEVRKTFDAGLASFIKEAKMLARFSHPGLVEVFRYWEANGTAYMAMRYYRGVTLREMLRSGAQAVTEQWLCETLDPILLALKELHAEKCYHRDIAPDNILVLPNGRSVLMDFGAARQIIGGMTQALTTVLKPGYAPIEQYSDDGSMEQGAWTDIYAVGALLYHAMTGKVPVQAISRMMNDPIKPVSELARGEFSSRLCEVVMKCLAVLPANRYQNVDELRAALGWVTTPVVSTVLHTTKVVPPVNAAPAFAKTEMVSHAGGVAHVDIPLGEGVSPQTPVPSPSADPLAALLAPEVAPSADAPQPGPLSMPAAARVADKAPSPAMVGAPSAPSKGKGLWVGLGLVLVLGAAVATWWGGSNKVDVVSTVPPAGVAVAPAAPADRPAAPTSEPATVASPEQKIASNPSSEAPGAGDGKSAAAPPDSAASNPALALPSASAPASVPAAPTTGTLRVELKDGWGQIFVNGEEKGTAPPVVVLRLAPGTYDIEIRNPALPTVKRSVEVALGKTAVVRHSFSK